MNSSTPTKWQYNKRAHLDFYQTPAEAVRALLFAESFDGLIWEPACGDGAISKELIKASYEVVSTDLADRNYGTTRQNFLKSTKPLAKHIVTNPPYRRYGLDDAFVRKALIYTKKTGGSVARLLNLISLYNPKRYHKFLKTPPTIFCFFFHSLRHIVRQIFTKLICYSKFNGKRQSIMMWQTASIRGFNGLYNAILKHVNQLSALNHISG